MQWQGDNYITQTATMLRALKMVPLWYNIIMVFDIPMALTSIAVLVGQ